MHSAILVAVFVSLSLAALWLRSNSRS